MATSLASMCKMNGWEVIEVFEVGCGNILLNCECALLLSPQKKEQKGLHQKRNLNRKVSVRDGFCPLSFTVKQQHTYTCARTVTTRVNPTYNHNFLQTHAFSSPPPTAITRSPSPLCSPFPLQTPSSRGSAWQTNYTNTIPTPLTTCL